MGDILRITPFLCIPLIEIEWKAIRSQGSGGQNVNKVSSAVHLRFNIQASSLPDLYKERLLALPDQRINQEGILVLKAQGQRTQERNRMEALRRLREIIRSVLVLPRKRRPTNPSRNSQRKRLEKKKQRGRLKESRGKINLY